MFAFPHYRVRESKGKAMEKFVPEGVNLPNVMTPGAWVIVGVVVSCALAGLIWMIVRVVQTTYIPWKHLPDSPLEAKYYGKDYTPNLTRPNEALNTAQALLIKNTTWKAVDVANALHGIRVYVMATPAWVDFQAGKVAGLDPAGPAVVVGSDFAALLHECAHQCEDFIDHVIEYDHKNWGAKGIWTADAAYTEWLNTTVTTSAT